MFPDPTTTRIVHDTMIAEELARQNPEHRGADRRGLVPRRLPGVRQATARWLVRLADRVTPKPAPEPEGAGA
jgi:hypothetical protein